MFIEANTNKDGLVSKASFNKLVDMAASIPRMYGYAPKDTELFLNEHGRQFARKKMFDSMNLKSTGVITFDKLFKFSIDSSEARQPPYQLIQSLTIIQPMATPQLYNWWLCIMKNTNTPAISVPMYQMYNTSPVYMTLYKQSGVIIYFGI